MRECAVGKKTCVNRHNFFRVTSWARQWRLTSSLVLGSLVSTTQIEKKFVSYMIVLF